jgi:recombination protein RecA
MYNEGISTSGDILDLAVELEIVVKRGSFYSYGEMRLGQGRENAKSFLAQTPALMAELDKAIRDRFGMAVSLAPKSVELEGALLNEEVQELEEMPGSLFAEAA